MADLAASVAHETSVFCGTITMDDGEGRWNVVPGRQRGNQKARLQALLEIKNNRVAIRNPFDALRCSQPAAAADPSSGVRRGVGGSKGEMVSVVCEFPGKTHTTHTHHTTHTNINNSNSNKSARSETDNGVGDQLFIVEK